MPVSINTEVVGAKEALRELAKLDKKVSNEIRKDARAIMKPIVDDAKAAIPETALSGWEGKWTSKKSGVQLTPWDAATARKMVKGKTSTKKPQEFNGFVRNLAVFYVSWAGGVNALFDMAGRRNVSEMANNLTGKFGPPSRIMWPAAEARAEDVEREMAKVIQRLMREYRLRA